MMKKTLLAIALSALSLTAFAASDTPDILAALSDDSAQQIALMTDEQLSDTKGSGITGYALSSYYYAWNFYGNKQDYRSYIYTGSSSQPGGAAIGNNFYKLGQVFYTTTQGVNAPIGSSAYTKIEEHTADYIVLNPTTLGYKNVASWSNWNRPNSTTFTYW